MMRWYRKASNRRGGYFAQNCWAMGKYCNPWKMIDAPIACEYEDE